jgi:hypothetical protein
MLEFNVDREAVAASVSWTTRHESVKRILIRDSGRHIVRLKLSPFAFTLLLAGTVVLSFAAVQIASVLILFS